MKCRKRGREKREKESWSLPKMPPSSTVDQLYMHAHHSAELGTKVLTRDMTAASSLISLL